MENLFDEMPYWKRVYQTITGGCGVATVEDVNTLLNTVQSQLVEGLRIFKPLEDENGLWEQFIRNRPDLNRIIRRLAASMRTDIVITWSIFCNYLTYVYHGRPEDIHDVSTNELRMMQMGIKYEHFYYMERMYLLKSVHYILSNYDNYGNPFQICFKRFVVINTMDNIRVSLLQQFHTCHVILGGEWRRKDKLRAIRCMDEIKQLCMTMVASSWGQFRRTQFASGELGFDVEPLMENLLHYIQGFHFRRYGYISELKILVGKSILLDFHFAHVAALMAPFSELWNNINVFENQRERIERNYRDSRYTSNNDYSTIFLVHWSLLLMTNPMLYDRAINYVDQHRGHIQDSLRTGVLRMLATFLNSNIIHDVEEGHRIRLTVYRYFQELYVFIDAEDGLYSAPGLVPLLVSLMEDQEIGRSILGGEDEVGVLPALKLNRIFLTVEDLFPFDFISFSSLMHSMMQYESYQTMALHKLKHLRKFTEARWEESVVFILTDHRPFHNNTVIIPAEQEAQILRRRGVDVHVYNTDSYMYFNILQLLMTRYLREEDGHCITNDDYGTAILSGLDLMMDILDYHEEFRLNPGFVACTNLVLNIIVHNMQSNQYDHDVVIRCLKVCIRLMKVMPDKLITFLKGMGIIPSIHMDYYVNQGLLTLPHLNVHANLLLIVDKDRADRRSEIVDIIIEMILYGISSGRYRYRLQLPLSVFLFEKMLAQFQLTVAQYSRPGYRVKTVAKIVQLLQQILLSEPTDEAGHALKQQCFHLLLTHRPFIRLFQYAVVQNTNSMIESALHQQPNWSDVVHLDAMRISKMCVSILLLLINKVGTFGKLIFTPFGLALVSVRPDSIDHIQILASLINNNFDPELRQAACRLFCKFAQTPALALLAHLDMDSYQVRSVFLEKLRDPMEENYNKVAIIDLIASSVAGQNALTAAFFNFPKFIENSNADFTDTVSGFIVEHLENVQRTPDLRTSPIHSAVLNLLEKIWVRGIELVMAPLMLLPNFWTSLTSTLFDDFMPPNDGYCNIINIFVCQIHAAASGGREYPPEFDTKLHELFAPRKDSWIIKFIRYLRRCLQRSNHSDTALLHAVRNLILEMTVNKREYFQSLELKGDLAFNCLQGLWEQMKNPVDTMRIEMWTCIYNHLMFKWGVSCYIDYEFGTIKLLTDIVNQHAINCNSMTTNIKLVMCSISCNIISHLKDVINENPQMLWEFLHAIRRVIEIEERIFYVEHQGQDLAHIYNWTILILLTGRVLELKCVEEYRSWFSNGSFFKHVMTTVSTHMSRPRSLNTAKVALETLTKYVTSDMHGQLTIEEMRSFYHKSHPPHDFLDFRPYDVKMLNERPFDAFWQTYMAMVQYNTALLRKRPSENFEACVSFFLMHWEVLDSLMKLATVTVEVSALELVQAILDFGSEMLLHKIEWSRSDLGTKMINDFFVMVRVCINSCIQIMISPNIIKFFTRTTAGLNVENVSDQVYVEVIEQILGILTTACACYNKATPSHIDLMSSEKITKKLVDSNIIDADFSIPKISSSVNTKLSYGDLLFLHQVLVQILYKVHNKSRPAGTSQQVPPVVASFNLESEVDSDSAIDLRRKIDKERRQLHQEKKSIKTTVAQSNDDRNSLWGLVCPDYVHRGVTDWTTRRVHEPDVSGMSAPWLDKVSEARTLSALEGLTTLLGNEIHIHLQGCAPKSPELLFFGRHFGTELQMFHDYVRKWRCGDIPLSVVLADISYHYTRQVSGTIAAQSQQHAHQSLVPPRAATMDLEPAAVFSVETPIPNLFRRITENDNRIDHFFAPATEVVAQQQDSAQLTNKYLLLLSHWLHYVCHTSD